MAWLRGRVAELEEVNARLREAARERDELAAAQLAARDAQIGALAAQVEELRRRLDKDSSTSSRPPSSDNPYKKEPRDRSLRQRSGRKPGKQPGAQSSTLRQSPEPDDTVFCGPAACGCCGRDLTGEPVLGTPQKRQVFEASPPPPPAVTEYQVAAKQCPECGVVSVGLAPAGVTGRVQYGPLVHAKTALVVCANYLPVARAARLVAALTGVNVSAGFVAGVRGKAARLLAPFMNRVRELLPAAPVLYADETPARAAGNCATCTWRALSSSPRCTPATGPAKRSTLAASCPATPAPSSATATGGISISPMHCTPGAARAGCVTWPGCTARPPRPGLGTVHG